MYRWISLTSIIKKVTEIEVSKTPNEALFSEDDFMGWQQSLSNITFSLTPFIDQSQEKKLAKKFDGDDTINWEAWIGWSLFDGNCKDEFWLKT